MARSPTDDLRFGDIPLNSWNFCTETGDNNQPAPMNERKPTPIPSNTATMAENNIYNTPNYSKDVYLNKHHFNVQTNECIGNKEENCSYNVPNGSIGNANYGNAMLKLDNGQLVRVFYDENNQQLIFPKSGQYELFNNNQGLCDMSMQQHNLFNMNQDFSVPNNVHIPPPTNVPSNSFCQENMNVQSNMQTSNFIKEVIGNWEPNSSGTYSPFGQNYPLKHPEAPSLNILPNNTILDPITQSLKSESSPKRNENSPLADTSNKKRIVAEVKPMRPSYSDVLAKNTKNNPQPENTRKVKPQGVENKNKLSSKNDKPLTNAKCNDDKHKIDKKQANTVSSGSESGDINADDTDRNKKANKKSKNKRSNMTRRWSSLDDLNDENGMKFEKSNESQFVFIQNNSDKSHKKDKKENKTKNVEKSNIENDFKIDDDEDDQSQFILHNGQTETAKVKKRKEGRSYHKTPKPAQDKKKPNQNKFRRNKPGYLGLAQNWLEHWADVTWKAIVWFFYLLSDICGMSLHLSFDLCTSAFTQTYMSSQAVWRSSKDWLSKMADNKFLLYIDRKLGHTYFGFWRKLKWFKKETEIETNSNATKLNTNIPLPATGEEAMKRLLACKGKDPYSILGVSVTCSDEDIKRYYRRQAFLVHPDKNPQPGAEEAFKILQHAFDLIGEPELREAYERHALESRHVEAAWSELSQLLTQLQDKMEFAANTIRCTNCGRRHKRVLTDRPCYAARYCAQCKIRHSAKEGDIWAESSLMGLLVMYYACMDGGVYQITQWASCQKKNLKQLRPDWHVVQYRIVLGNKAADVHHSPAAAPTGHDPNLEEFLNNLYSKSGASANNASKPADVDKRRRARKQKP
ncbi:dnaJ homolog dnj-5 [Papilio machaon]|uniref:dnaJ homolog dnj-5 n=1 Tax=Papilio machaon TaxID=76193 RepID=UPI001E66388E|nr:dnaJ homolog dnj-5 [Papilio machaon]